MRIYSSTRTIYPELARNGLLKCTQELRGHTSLAQVCWIHGISVERGPMRFGDLQDAAPLSRQAIEELLLEDARNRNDSTDRLLIEAIAADITCQT